MNVSVPGASVETEIYNMSKYTRSIYIYIIVAFFYSYVKYHALSISYEYKSTHICD